MAAKSVSAMRCHRLLVGWENRESTCIKLLCAIAFEPMYSNPLQSNLDTLGENIGVTVGMLFQLDAHLTDYKKKLLKSFECLPVGPDYQLLTSTLVIGDLTGNLDNGWKINFPTDYRFQMKLGEVEAKIDLLIERESMRSIAHCYEVLESYMFDITATYLFLHRENHKELIQKKLKPASDTIDEFRDSIRGLRGKNNKEILNLIRSLSDHFRDAEQKNNEGVDLKDWFEVLSKVRHGIIHSNFKLKKVLARPLTHNEKIILDRYFPNVETDICFDLKIQKKNANKILNLMMEYAILIFKSFSILSGYDWKVFKYMDGPPGYGTQQSL